MTATFSVCSMPESACNTCVLWPSAFPFASNFRRDPPVSGDRADRNNSHDRLFARLVPVLALAARPPLVAGRVQLGLLVQLGLEMIDALQMAKKSGAVDGLPAREVSVPRTSAASRWGGGNAGLVMNRLTNAAASSRPRARQLAGCSGRACGVKCHRFLFFRAFLYQYGRTVSNKRGVGVGDLRPWAGSTTTRKCACAAFTGARPAEAYCTWSPPRCRGCTYVERRV